MLLRVGLEGARPHTTTNDPTRPRTTTHDHPHANDHARLTTHERPRTTTKDRPRTTDHASVDKTAAIFVWGSGTCGATL